MLYSINVNALKHNKDLKATFVNTASVGYERDIYTIDDSLQHLKNSFGQREKYELENHFNKVYETKYRKLLGQVINKKYLGIDDAALFIYALTNLKFRNKYYRDNTVARILPGVLIDLRNRELEILHSVEGEYYRGQPKEEAIDVINSITEQAKNSGSLVKDFHLMSFYKSNDNSESARMKVIDILLRLKWTIVHNNTKLPFITTDNPGYCIDPDSKSIQNVKFGEPFSYFIPLRPNVGLLIDSNRNDEFLLQRDDIKLLANFTAPEEIVKTLNIGALNHFTDRIFSYYPNGCDYIIDQLKTERSQL